jgi:DNA-binding NarL/FixJ family response regulator
MGNCYPGEGGNHECIRDPDSGGNQNVLEAPVTDLQDPEAVTVAPASRRIRILLVEDHALMREALKALLETDPEIEVVGEAADFSAGLSAVIKLKPAVAVIDVSLPDRSGIELAAELKARGSSTHVLILTAHATKEYVRAALNAGALGYVLKDASRADLLKGLRTVSGGRMYLCVCQSVKAEVSLPDLTPDASLAIRAVRVTSREREVLAGVALSLSNKQIARSLHISNKTVEKHRGNLMRKLDLHGVAALTRFAMREGLIRPLGSVDTLPARASESPAPVG